jgi:HK97 family phage portal protein
MAFAFTAMLRRLFRKQYQGVTPTLPGDRSNYWWPVIRESYAGAWQHNMELRTENILAFHAVYACIERIASDVAKCRLKLVEMDDDGIWREFFSPAFTPVITKPNHYQTRIQFFEAWILSKLMSGNTYIWKERDARNIVVRLYILDPACVHVLVAPNGDVYYELNRDNLAGIQDRITVPSSEIIHDMTTIRHHPLCGLSPMAPASLAATHGINIQRTSNTFFQNSAKPSGVLVAPDEITDDDAERIKTVWNEQLAGIKAGKIGILDRGLKFEKFTMDFVDAQLIEQLGISAKQVCSSFGVPPHMVQVGDPPSYNNIESLNQQYYSQTLQKHFEAVELLLDEGLGLTEVVGKTYGTEFELDDLLRMETKTLIAAEAEAVKAFIKSPDEARKRLNLPPVEQGAGRFPLAQQQNYSLLAIAKRDAQPDPFAPASPPAGQPPAEPPADGGGNVPADQAAQQRAEVVSQLANWELRACLLQ